jgi:hypothetical protein
MMAHEHLRLCRMSLLGGLEKAQTANSIIDKIGQPFPIGQTTFHYTESDVVNFLESAQKEISYALAQAVSAKNANDSFTQKIVRGECTGVAAVPITKQNGGAR